MLRTLTVGGVPIMDGCLHFDRIGFYPTRRYVVICKVCYSDAIKISKTVDQLYSDTSPNPPMEWSKCCLRRCRIIILDTKSFFWKNLEKSFVFGCGCHVFALEGLRLSQDGKDIPSLTNPLNSAVKLLWSSSYVTRLWSGGWEFKSCRCIVDVEIYTLIW